MLRPLSWRFRFSLRVMLVVITCFAMLFGYHLNWIQRRREVLAGNYASVISQNTAGGTRPAHPAAPALLRLFGESGAYAIAVTCESESQWLAESQRIGNLFPEVKLIRVNGARR